MEFLFPYNFAAEDTAQRLQDNGLPVALHNLPAGSGPGGTDADLGWVAAHGQTL